MVSRNEDSAENKSATNESPSVLSSSRISTNDEAVSNLTSSQASSPPASPLPSLNKGDEENYRNPSSYSKEDWKSVRKCSRMKAGLRSPWPFSLGSAIGGASRGRSPSPKPQKSTKVSPLALPVQTSDGPLPAPLVSCLPLPNMASASARQRAAFLQTMSKKLARMGAHMFLQMLLQDNFVHADLHPGNILIRWNISEKSRSESRWSRLKRWTPFHPLLSPTLWLNAFPRFWPSFLPTSVLPQSILPRSLYTFSPTSWLSPLSRPFSRPGLMQKQAEGTEHERLDEGKNEVKKGVKKGAKKGVKKQEMTDEKGDYEEDSSAYELEALPDSSESHFRLLRRGMAQKLGVSQFLYRFNHFRRRRTPMPMPTPTLELVILDAGLTAKLTRSDRVNFVDLFTAVAFGEGWEAGRLLLERAKHQECRDPDDFCESVAKIVSRFIGPPVRLVDLRAVSSRFTMRNLRMGQALQDILSLSMTHKVELDPAFVGVVIAVTILEGVGRTLDPDIDLWAVARPFLQNIVKTQFSRF